MILPILQYGDPILRAKGERIEEIDDRIRELAVNMIETMHEAHGVGLAAQQVGQPLQLTVLDISAVEDRPSTLKLSGKDVDPNSAMPVVLINPEIELRGETNARRPCSCGRKHWKAKFFKSRRAAFWRAPSNTSTIISTEFYSSIG